MLDDLRWSLSLRRNVNFWDWLQDTYTIDTLRQLVAEATDCSLIRPWNPLAEPSNDPHSAHEVSLRKTARRLMDRYGDEIWSICLGAGGYNPDGGPTGLACLSNLNLAFQVYDPDTFTEFMVRHAIKRGAQQVLDGQEMMKKGFGR